MVCKTFDEGVLDLRVLSLSKVEEGGRGEMKEKRPPGRYTRDLQFALSSGLKSLTISRWAMGWQSWGLEDLKGTLSRHGR